MMDMHKMSSMVWRSSLLILLFSATSLFAQQGYDARGAAMAFSNGADTRGLQHVGLNPATVALRTWYNFELNLASAAAEFGNNSLRKEQYDAYFTEENYFLTEENRDDILSVIPEEGLEAGAAANILGLAFFAPNFSLSVTGEGLGAVTVPRDAIELAFRGNADEGRTYTFDQSDGVGAAMVSFRLSGAYQIPVDKRSPFRFAALGMTMKYMVGLGYGEVLDFSGSFENFDLAQNRPFLALNGHYEAIQADGGNGFGIDLGGIVRFKGEDLTIGLSFVNLLGSIDWNSGTERRTVDIIDGNEIQLPDGIPDSIHVSQTTEIPNFSRTLPRTMNLSIGYRPMNEFLLTASYDQGLNETMGAAKDARFAMGAEYAGLSFLPLRTGITLGDADGVGFGLGFGINAKFWYLDVGYITRGGIFPGNSSRQATIAATTRLRF